jgi:ADP-dependent NAD(P)H-hydrate dehydratase / NAD(P)H-hydrate epimerase
MRIVNITEMKEIESLARDKYFFDESLIIENVGVKGASVIQEKVLEHVSNAEIIFLIGKGNNGADGLAIARHLTTLGHHVRAFKLFNDQLCTSELKRQAQMADAYGVIINHVEDLSELEDYFHQLPANVIVVDAMFGTGVQLPLSNFIYDVINFINQNASYTIAIDIPSGVEGDSGFIQGNAIRANLTLAVALPKLGYYMADGARHVGDIEILDVGFPLEILEKGNKFLLGLEDIVDPITRRDKFADKKIFGHTLVIGGSHGLTGAPVMASQAALKVGAGLITAATWEPQYQEFITRLIPEVMTGYIPLDTNKWPRLIADLNKYSAIVIGPGLARSTRARKLVLEILHNFDGPVVVDADAINVLSLKEDRDVFAVRNAPTVLTPHFGEFARFAGIDYDDLSRKPVHYLQQLVDQTNCTVILKGACTYLGFTNGDVYFNFFPNDGMATGGVGDVLAGILGGLLGQDPELKENQPLINRYENFNKTVGLAVLIHSYAGHLAAQKLGVRAMTAVSIIDAFPDVFNSLDEKIAKLEENGNV